MLVVDDLIPLLQTSADRALLAFTPKTRVEDHYTAYDPGHLEDQRHYLIAADLGLQFLADDSGLISTIFCMIQGDNLARGQPWSFRNGLGPNSTRRDVIAALGVPDRSGDVWDRFSSLPNAIIHVTYDEANLRITMITLMTPQTSP